MAERVIALSVGNASIPLYAEDWPAIKKAVEESLSGREARAYHVSGEKELISATRYTVADRSRLATGA
ncbi:hypothetical protein [Modicisalibacter tunisiensis]|uniref:Uncharacterized protein n=1 Tax=Modicisalibacter tunisiensis TaxID=390637 RepID=A0ABS7X2Y7_9GAMM|nr:hypothetical protein [Modicisalibacter tunisiensis]MBZ9540509.1 hypothetical protein [Modicisalibacter tunisiensis]MBZ9569263.1 hypothetical protein [Modicisalibacter tunisiensis]